MYNDNVVAAVQMRKLQSGNLLGYVGRHDVAVGIGHCRGGVGAVVIAATGNERECEHAQGKVMEQILRHGDGVETKKVRANAYATTLERTLIGLIYSKDILLLQLTVAVHEAVYATCSVDQLVLTRIERVRSARDFDLYHWISLAFKLYCIICLSCRLCKEHIAVGHIFEYDGAIVFWVNTLFHFVVNCYY